MDYEQKYNAALERAKEYHDNGGAPLMLEVIFPELKESEEEKIKRELRNDLILYVPTPERYIAWLEKLGEKFTAIDVDKMVMEYSHTKDGDFGLPVNCMTRAYRKGINDALKLL